MLLRQPRSLASNSNTPSKYACNIRGLRERKQIVWQRFLERQALRMSRGKRARTGELSDKNIKSL